MMADANNIDIVCENVYFLLHQCKKELCDEAIEEIRYYLEHREPEIAFEGLFIELMNTNFFPVSLDKDFCFEIAKSLNLDTESVLDDLFWERFTFFASDG